ncbi:hypothetical protein CGOTT_02530 [Corynebacterium gottingense]|nr:hypothetical protein CGOTT_02530 [Corynebacterium gottingense]WJZ14787.1 hypothetical protein CGOTTB_02520 [Corynebacterium gottingense]WKC59445.1 hypothetical protein CHAD_02675 [Corynebacterium hadale]
MLCQPIHVLQKLYPGVVKPKSGGVPIYGTGVNPSWEETLLIVTADHETGYLTGANDVPGFSPLAGESQAAPEHKYNSGDHTNQLVPFFFKGAGSEDILAAAEGEDPVRGKYIDNTTIAKLTKENWWAEAKAGDQGDAAEGSSKEQKIAAGVAGGLALVLALIAGAYQAGLLPNIPGLPKF